AQFEAAGAGGGVDVGELGAGLDADYSRFLPFDLVEQRGREHDATLERHALPVIAGRAAADRQRNAVLGAGGGDANHLALVAGRNHDVGNLVFQQVGEDWTVPIVVARVALEVGDIGRRFDAGDVGEKFVDRIAVGWLVSGERGGLRHGASPIP